ncbi:MAG: type VII secretion protein EccB [Streptosporangiaceae bacterium]
MQNRKDLLAAHRLMTQRAALALLRAEPDIPDQPMRRLNVAAFCGVLAALIVGALFVIWGIIAPGSVSLRPGDGDLVIDSGTGTSMVFCEKTRLCPVVNYASARLALGLASPSQQTVSQAALRSYPRGPQIGIPGLPDPLPEAAMLVQRPWSVCAQGTATALAGGIGVGGRPLRSAALLVQAEGQDWVIWDGSRMAIAAVELSALSNPGQPVSVPPVWLNALPEGRGFAPPVIAHKGRPWPAGPAGRRALVGQVYSVSVAGGVQDYVLTVGGLARISPVQAELLEYAPHAPPEQSLQPAAVSSYHVVGTLPAQGLPASSPRFTVAGSSVPRCVVYGASGGSTLRRQVMIGGRLPAGGVPAGVPGGVSRIDMPNGAGALVGIAPSAGARGTVSYFLVCAGKRFALAAPSVAAMLGYQHLARQAALLPAGLVDLIPQGPVLNPKLATRPVTGGG